MSNIHQGKKAVTNFSYAIVCFTMYGPLKTLLCHFPLFLFSGINMTFFKHFMKKHLFQGRFPRFVQVYCLTTFCDLATLSSKMTSLWIFLEVPPFSLGKLNTYCILDNFSILNLYHLYLFMYLFMLFYHIVQ